MWDLFLALLQIFPGLYLAGTLTSALPDPCVVRWGPAASSGE